MEKLENKFNGWLHTGETENGLQIWAQEHNEDGVRYLKIIYKDSNGNRVGKREDYPISQVRLLNAIVDSLEMEYGVK